FATLLGFGVFVMGYAERWKIPPAFFLLLVGLFFGPTILNLVSVPKMGDVPDFLRILSLVIIVFAGSFHLKLSTFKKVSRMAIKLAFVGFVVSVISLGAAAHWIFDMSWASSLILASIVGGTSSAAIFTFKKALGGSEALSILTVESIFTDPLTVLVPVLLMNAFMSGAIQSSTQFLGSFWQMISAGIGTGIIIGFLAAELFKREERELSPILSFAIAMITYSLARNVGGSGILAVAICAIILGNRNIPFKKDILKFEDSMSTILTISVFTLLGAQIDLILESAILLKSLLFIIITIFVVRPIMTYTILYKDKVPKRDLFLIAFTGPRGAASAAVAAMPIAYAAQYGAEAFVTEAQTILLVTFLVILATLFSSTVVDYVYSKIFGHRTKP
ncbi:MAG: cation:proton antiporter, partial [archaeon]|nr:cation:proton antiporter [archaeon]